MPANPITLSGEGMKEYFEAQERLQQKIQIAGHFGPSEEVAYFGNVCCTVRHDGPDLWTWRSMLMANGFVQKVKVGKKKDRIDACKAAYDAAIELENAQ